MKAWKLLLTGAFLAAPTWAATITYVATLNGPSESPVNSSLGTGRATVTINTTTNMMEVAVQFQGLTGTTTISHIHCCTASPFAGTAGVATATPTFPNFPASVTSGTYDQIFDLTLASTYNPTFIPTAGGVAAAESLLLAGMAAGDTYLNIHTNMYQGGEIRGFLAVATPEPGTWALGAAAFAGLLLRRPKCV